MADNLTPITSDQLTKVTAAQDTDLVTLGINGNFVTMTLGDLKNVLGITALNTNKADVEDVTSKFNWGTSINYKAVRIGKMVIFRATCTAKTTEPMNFAIINVPALVPVTWTQLNAYTDSGDDFDKRAIAFVTENKVMARTYAGYNTTQPEALTGNVIVNGSWIIN